MTILGCQAQTEGMSKPTTFAEYRAAFSGESLHLLDALHRLSRETVPDGVEAIKWGHPAILHPSGMILFVFSAHQHHASVAFTPSTRQAFAQELEGFETGKGSVKLPYGTPVPTDLLARMIAYRITEYERDGVTWM